MNNPCGECIVNAICKDPCDPLESYVKYRLDKRNEECPVAYTIIRIAKELRKEIVVLDSNDPWGYRYIK